MLKIWPEKFLKRLPLKPSKLTGNEIHFIRTYLGESKSSFGEIFKLSHAAIGKWEKSKDSPAPISPGQEIILRLYIEDYLNVGVREFYKAYKSMEDAVYQEEEEAITLAL